MTIFLDPITDKERDKLDSLKSPYKHLRIGMFRLWTIFLHENQAHLGRSYLWLNRHTDLHAFTDLTEEEVVHLRLIGAKITSAYAALWKPDLVNVSWLGNEYQLHRGHGHAHFVPRYSSPRRVGRKMFVDPEWGHNYNAKRLTPISKDKRREIRNLLRQEVWKGDDCPVY